MSHTTGCRCSAGVLVINAAILTAAVVLLALTPLTVSFPIALEQALVLGGALALMVVANRLLLRGGLRPLHVVLRAVEKVELLPAPPNAEVGGAETRAIARAINVTLDRLEDERRSSSRRVSPPSRASAAGSARSCTTRSGSG